MIVVDASALVELIIGGTPRAAAVARRVGRASESLHAPELVDLEVASVLRTLERTKLLDRLTASRALVDLVAADVTRYAHASLLPRIWQLRGNLTAYDAAYVALAENLAAPLITCDRQLARAPGHQARIELVA